jgi:hypothetical protein
MRGSIMGFACGWEERTSGMNVSARSTASRETGDLRATSEKKH